MLLSAGVVAIFAATRVVPAEDKRVIPLVSDPFVLAALATLKTDIIAAINTAKEEIIADASVNTDEILAAIA